MNFLTFAEIAHKLENKKVEIDTRDGIYLNLNEYGFATMKGIMSIRKIENNKGTDFYLKWEDEGKTYEYHFDLDRIFKVLGLKEYVEIHEPKYNIKNCERYITDAVRITYKDYPRYENYREVIMDRKGVIADVGKIYVILSTYENCDEKHNCDVIYHAIRPEDIINIERSR